MRKKLVVGNWKMHGSLRENEALIGAIAPACASLREVECAVCVPYPYLAQVQVLLTGTPVGWGAQNLSEHPKGAYTGEVSGAMLADFACRYVIVGHSERRTLYGEDDAVVARKFIAARSVGLTPILCVGETWAERESGGTGRVVRRQVERVVDSAGVEALRDAVLAYEPVWAIGTGKTPAPEEVQAVHRLLRELIAERDSACAQQVRVLYGGSVKAANAVELFSLPDVDGGLVGGASLVAAEFLAICAAAGQNR